MKNKLLLVTFNLMTLFIFSQNISIEEKINTHFSSLTKIECQYQQEKYLSMLKKPLISTGTFKYNKDGEISWNQQTPFKEIFLINQDADNKIDMYISKFIISILSGDILHDKKLSVDYIEEGGNYIVIITPVKGAMKKKVESISLTFNSHEISLNKLEINSKNQDITIINFY